MYGCQSWSLHLRVERELAAWVCGNSGVHRSIRCASRIWASSDRTRCARARRPGTGHGVTGGHHEATAPSTARAVVVATRPGLLAARYRSCGISSAGCSASRIRSVAQGARSLRATPRRSICRAQRWGKAPVIPRLERTANRIAAHAHPAARSFRRDHGVRSSRTRGRRDDTRARAHPGLTAPPVSPPCRRRSLS